MIFQEKPEPVSSGRDPSPLQVQQAHLTERETEAQGHTVPGPANWDGAPGPSSSVLPSLSSPHPAAPVAEPFLQNRTFQRILLSQEPEGIVSPRFS